METKNWKWFKISDLFDKPYKGFAYNAQNLTFCDFKHPMAVRYVTRTDVDNGCKGFVINEDFVYIETCNAITIGDTTATIFYQENEFICGDHMVILRSHHLNKVRGLFIISLLNKERYRYNYGRAFKKDLISNTRLKLPIDNNGKPDWQWIENYVKETLISKLPSKTKSVWKKEFDKTPISPNKLQLNTKEWKWFRYDEVFEIKKGFYNKKPEENPNGEIPFIGATDSNNGITSFHDLNTIESSSKTGEIPNAPLKEKLFSKNSITVSNNGSVGYAFYQKKEFTCTHDVNPLYLKNKIITPYIAMFLCTIIEMERFRWAYGRKWRPVRMPSSKIKLPAIKNDKGDYEPDWQWMEDYIKGLPYSGCL